jgi:hypothetical protein
MNDPARTRMAAAATAGAVAGALVLGLFVFAVSRLHAEPPTPPAVAAATADALAANDGYRVWGRQDDGSPVRWDPCTPIRYVFDDRLAPDDARETLRLALSRISAATGLTFENVGDTTEPPSLERALTAPGVDGVVWAPVLITWVPGGSTDLPMGDEQRGVAVPVAVRDGGPRVFVTGQVVLNSDKTLLPGFEDRHAAWGAVLLHEIGHLVGLDHVDDPVQLMHPTPGFGPVVLGEGDKIGLATIGAAGGCLAQPAPQDLAIDFD